MRIFVSYSRQDDQAVESLTRDLERLDHQVWRDRELSGGQVWWDTILARIRECELFAVALSPSAVLSEACRRESDYARALGKPILPVRVHPDVSLALLPPYLAESQYVDYVQRDVNTGLELARALGRLHPAGPLPEVLPTPPAVPISYLTALKDEVDAPTALTFEQQSALVAKLRARLGDADDRRDVLVLLHRMRDRPDLLASVAREIDALLPAGYGPGTGAWAGGDAAGYGPPPGAARTDPAGPPPPRGQAAGSPWAAAPAGGTGGGAPAGPQSQTGGWTGGREAPPFGPPGRYAGAPAGTGASVGDAPWSSATFVLMLVGSLLCMPVGLVAGIVGYRSPAKRSQAIALLATAAVSLILGVLIAAGQQSSSSGF